MTLTYENLHWGVKSKARPAMRMPVGRGKVVCELRAISYVAHKGDEREVYRHDFTRFKDPETGKKRWPYLLRVGTTGEFEIGPAPPLVAIGQVIDVEDAAGDRILLPEVWVATDEDGDHVWLASIDGIPFALERREEGPRVDERGIVN